MDRYERLEVIGEGASATVYKAVDRIAGGTVALKVLRPHLTADPICLERLRREVQITRRVSHPRIVSTYGLVLERGSASLAMEYVDGQDLKRFIKIRHPVPIETAVSILAQVLEGLSACHARNVIHRDLKAQNILIAERHFGDGAPSGAASVDVKLVDFGIAKMLALSDLNQTGTSVGSPEYMAPELFSGGRCDPRADLYAVGVIAFELVVGRLPFHGDSLATLCAQHVAAPIPEVSAERGDVPEWLAQLITRLLAKRPSERYQSADEVLDDLRAQRVAMRALPAPEKRLCTGCGSLTLAALPLCAFCGWSPADAVRVGRCDLHCAPEADAVRLDECARAIGARGGPRARRRRTLLLARIDSGSADVIQRSAATLGVALSVRRHRALPELRRALILVVVCFGTRLIADIAVQVMKAHQVWVPRYFRFADALETVRLSGWGGAYYATELAPIWRLAVPLIAGWMCLRRFRGAEILPLWAAPEGAGNEVSPFAWATRLQPYLAATRTDEAKSFVAGLLERYALLDGPLLRCDPALAHQLQGVVEQAARVAATVSAIERAGAATDERDPACIASAIARDMRFEVDPDACVELRSRLDALRAEMRCHWALDGILSDLATRRAALAAHFNRLAGVVLVDHSPIDAAIRTQLEEDIRSLDGDLTLAREVERDLRRLG